MEKNLYLLYGVDRYTIKNKTFDLLKKLNIDRSGAEFYDMEEVLID